jgi:hypothetical protein
MGVIVVVMRVAMPMIVGVIVMMVIVIVMMKVRLTARQPRVLAEHQRFDRHRDRH